MDEDFDQGDDLNMFFLMLAKMNGGKPIEPGFQKKVEEFFHWKWTNDKNLFVASDEEHYMLSVLPSEVQEKLYCSFLFTEFLKNYQIFFRFERNSSNLFI